MNPIQTHNDFYIDNTINASMHIGFLPPLIEDGIDKIANGSLAGSKEQGMEASFVSTAPTAEKHIQIPLSAQDASEKRNALQDGKSAEDQFEDPLKEWTTALFPMVMQYIGDKKDIDNVRKVSTSVFQYVPEADYAIYDEEYRNKLVAKYVANFDNQEALLPIELEQIVHAAPYVTSLDLSKQRTVPARMNAKVQTLVQLFCNLVSLNLSETNLDTLPQLPKSLKELDLSFCKNIADEGLASIVDLPVLENLNLRQTKITHLPKVSATLKILRILHCDHLVRNGLSHLTQLTQLQVAQLCYNPIVDLPDLPRALVELDLSGSWQLEPGSLRSIARLEHVEKLSLTGTTIDEMPKLPQSLRILDISFCQISEEQLQGISEASSLEILDMRGLNIANLPQFPKSLQEVDLSSCSQLTNEGIRSLSFAVNLKKVYFGYLPIDEEEDLPDDYEPPVFTELPVLPPSLTILSLNGCRNLTCNGLKSISDSNLKELDLSGIVSLTDVPKLAKSLEKLTLSDCENLTSSGLGALSEAEQLQYVDLSVTAIEVLPALPPKIEVLNLQACSKLTFKGIEPIAHLEKLKALYLIGCEELDALPPLSKTLEKLYLSRCTKLREPSFKILETCTNLRELDVSHTAITALPESLSSSLTKFECWDCKQLTDQGIKPLSNTKISKLNLYGLKITTLFDLPESLQELHIIGCSNLSNSGLQYITKAKNLVHLEITANECVTQLPLFPKSLKKFWLSRCFGFAHLAPISSSCIEELHLQEVGVMHIPPLPTTLTEFKLSRCQVVTTLPPLPEHLTYLHIDNCDLLTYESWRVLSSATALRHLYMEGADIDKLPPLPDSIEQIFVGGFRSANNLAMLREKYPHIQIQV